MSMVSTFYSNGNTVKFKIQEVYISLHVNFLNLKFDSFLIEIESWDYAHRSQLEKLFRIEVWIL